MVHLSMRNGSRVTDELYINRVLLVLEDFLFFSLYLFSCIANQVTTLKQLRLLAYFDCRDMKCEYLLSCFRYHILVTNITCARPRPLQMVPQALSALRNTQREELSGLGLLIAG